MKININKKQSSLISRPMQVPDCFYISNQLHTYHEKAEKCAPCVIYSAMMVMVEVKVCLLIRQLDLNVSIFSSSYVHLFVS